MSSVLNDPYGLQVPRMQIRTVLRNLERSTTMNHSLAYSCLLLLSGVSSVASMDKFRRRRGLPAPHEVHEYEQVKFEDEPEWSCDEVTVADTIGCLKCINPRPTDQEALIVEVKSMYKRTDFDVRDEILDPPRKHCIFPGRGPFFTCMNHKLVIEPDTSWLGSFKDKPIYDADGELGGDQCLPASIAATLTDSGSFF